MALVTGGAGFIGSHLADALTALDGVETVVVLDDLSSGSLANLEGCLRTGKLVFVNGDVRDRDLVGRLMEQFGFDYVFHLAAKVSVADSV
ncbi:hypothetical protein DRO33_05885, partial [Candidatus Bathyarchaeota archaeon]